MEARCMKCKEQVEIKHPQQVVSRNNLHMIKGVCPKCETKVCRILGKVKEGVKDDEELE